MMIGNLIILGMCLTAILVFKGLVGDQAAGFIDQFGPTPEGSGEVVTDPNYEIDRSIGVAATLLHQALDEATRRSTTRRNTIR